MYSISISFEVSTEETLQSDAVTKYTDRVNDQTPVIPRSVSVTIAHALLYFE